MPVGDDILREASRSNATWRFPIADAQLLEFAIKAQQLPLCARFLDRVDAIWIYSEMVSDFRDRPVAFEDGVS